MSDQNDQSRTEEPTSRRRDRARNEGQIVFSPDLSSGAMLCVVSSFCLFFWSGVSQSFSEPLAEAFRNLRLQDWDIPKTALAARWLFSHLLFVAGIVCLLTTGTALLATHLQSGFTMTTEPLTPKWEKISPVTGWNRLLSLESLFRGGLSVLKLITSFTVLILILRYGIQTFRAEQSGFIVSETPVAQTVLLSVMICLSGVTLFWGIVDYAIRWVRHEEKLKMSKQEVKDEHKEDQGDPLIRGKIRKAQKEAANRRTLSEVPQATMVITNPTHYAVALKYQTGSMGAPIIIAKGTDAFARRVAETARKNGVPVFERKPLTRAIFAIADIGDEIPIEFYRAIAELLSNVYRIKGKVG